MKGNGEMMLSNGYRRKLEIEFAQLYHRPLIWDLIVVYGRGMTGDFTISSAYRLMSMDDVGDELHNKSWKNI
ncbi:hypothetical protein A2U01_0013061 [Trifolium medium]|uniref:Uncharacterized protein n=1 Tax=Trifolium medium TaxID=97028 RepID=A0A392MX78_9FABA|nr:hypothetical protein [Trifolium medium]